MSSTEGSKNEEKSKTSNSAESSRTSAESPGTTSERKEVPSQSQSDPLGIDSTNSSPMPKPIGLEDNSLNPDITSQQTKTNPKSLSRLSKSFSITKKASSNEEEGGEWGLLSENMSNWWQKNDFQTLSKNLVGPLLIVICLAILILLFQIYGNILNVIAQFPLAPRLFELTGIIWLIYFSITRLARNKDRNELVDAIRSRWENFLGQSQSKNKR